MLRPNPRLILAGSGRVRRPCPNHRESSAKSPSPLANGGYRGVPMARQHGTRQPAPGRRDRTIRSPASYWAVEKSVLHKLRFPPDFVAPSSLRCEGGSPFFPPLRRGGRRGGPGTTSHRRFPRSLPLSPFASLSRGEKNRSRPSRLPHHPPYPPFARGGKGSLPPCEGGRHCSLTTSLHRAQQKLATRNRPSSTVNTDFSSPHGGPPLQHHKLHDHQRDQGRGRPPPDLGRSPSQGSHLRLPSGRRSRPATFRGNLRRLPPSRGSALSLKVTSRQSPAQTPSRPDASCRDDRPAGL